jgi:hypothetical protein
MEVTGAFPHHSYSKRKHTSDALEDSLGNLHNAVGGAGHALDRILLCWVGSRGPVALDVAAVAEWHLAAHRAVGVSNVQVGAHKDA